MKLFILDFASSVSTSANIFGGIVFIEAAS